MLCLCCVKCTFPSQSVFQEPVTDNACVWERERESVCVCVCVFVYMNACIWSPGLDGSCNLCVVFLLLWERNVSLHVHALMDSLTVNLLRYVELQKFGAVFSSLFWWFWDFVRWFQRWSFKIPYCSDHRLMQCTLWLLITSLVSWIHAHSCSEQRHVSCRNTVTHGME